MNGSTVTPKRKVAVTGIGAVTPCGIGEDEIWQHLVSSKTGIRRIHSLDVSDYKSKNGAEIEKGKLETALKEAGLASRKDRTIDLAMLAAGTALKQSGLVPDAGEAEPWNVAVIAGTGTGVSHTLYETFTGYFEKGLRGVRPTSVPRGMANAISSQLSMQFKLTGPNYVTVSACSSSTNAIGIGFRMIRDGYSDAVLCVGTDAPFDPFLYGAWNNLGVLSKKEAPELACRPFDKDRDGCVLGEGAGALVLENEETALARGAGIRAEIAGYGESSDAEHITRPSPEGQEKAIRMALDSAGISPEHVGYINAHGTATKANDPAESQSIRVALGSETDRIPVASNKSFFGHLLGACGAVESIMTILSLENELSPANLNLDERDPECNLNLVPTSSAQIDAEFALKNSFGFGGNNAVLVIKKR